MAYHLHWDMSEILTLEHDDRIRIVKEISRLNTRAAQGGGNG